MKAPARTHTLWLAYMLHRLSGLGLALFLPLHFWVLGRALKGADALEASLSISNLPLVKLAEFGLVFLLAVHFFGGLRLLVLEFLPWPAPHKTLAAGAVALSFLISTLFFLQAI